MDSSAPPPGPAPCRVSKSKTEAPSRVRGARGGRGKTSTRSTDAPMASDDFASSSRSVDVMQEVFDVNIALPEFAPPPILSDQPVSPEAEEQQQPTEEASPSSGSEEVPSPPPALEEPDILPIFSDQPVSPEAEEQQQPTEEAPPSSESEEVPSPPPALEEPDILPIFSDQPVSPEAEEQQQPTEEASPSSGSDEVPSSAALEEPDLAMSPLPPYYPPPIFFDQPVAPSPASGIHDVPSQAQSTSPLPPYHPPPLFSTQPVPSEEAGLALSSTPFQGLATQAASPSSIMNTISAMTNPVSWMTRMRNKYIASA